MNETKPRVFVVNNAGHNLTDAQRYGALLYLSQDKVNVFSCDRIAVDFKERLRGFNPTRDYLLLSGSIVLNVIAVKILSERFQRINVLLYNFKLGAGRYVVRTI